jgi:hypothetical protein
MKNLTAVFTAIVTIVVGFGGVADAASVYPPKAVSVVATPASGEPGYDVSVTVDCTLGEDVTVTLVVSTDWVACASDEDRSSGIATGVVRAPSSPGDFTGAVKGSRSGPLGQFTVTVHGAVRPAANVEVTQARGGPGGETDSSEYVRVAGSLFVVALCVMAVAALRRREMLLGA